MSYLQNSKAKNCYLHLSFLVFQQFTGAKYKEAWKNAYGMDFIVKSGSGKLLVSLKINYISNFLAGIIKWS